MFGKKLFLKSVDNRNTKLMAQRSSHRYGRKGSIHSNQGYFAVNRDVESGRFVSR